MGMTVLCDYLDTKSKHRVDESQVEADLASKRVVFEAHRHEALLFMTALIRHKVDIPHPDFYQEEASAEQVH